jgi:hypothetical protein
VLIANEWGGGLLYVRYCMIISDYLYFSTLRLEWSLKLKINHILSYPIKRLTELCIEDHAKRLQIRKYFRLSNIELTRFYCICFRVSTWKSYQ